MAETFRSVNGALFPGGSGDLPRAARTMYSLAIKANRAGDYFPIWGTCDGFEWLMQVMVVRMPMHVLPAHVQPRRCFYCT